MTSWDPVRAWNSVRAWDPALAGLLADHLWQSTLFLAIVALLTLALRNNRAQVRYALWLAASAKFLVPFALFVTLGSYVRWPSPAAIPALPAVAAIDAVSQPFSRGPYIAASPVMLSQAMTPSLPFILLVVWLVGCLGVVYRASRQWRRVAAVVREATVVDEGRELDVLRRIDSGTVPLVASNGSLEPGVFGIVRPVLVWPRSITARLTDDQIEAIFAHELAHIRRHDNLAAAMHIAVQAIFWFHPLVWWVGARLIDERERACDDEVLRLGGRPEVYAESILKTCEFYLESPLVCVSGITGSDLKKRIETIMTARLPRDLRAGAKLLLATAGLIAIVAPIGFGIAHASGLRAQSARQQKFEVASIKPWKLVDGNSREARIIAFGADPASTLFIPTATGRFTATAVTLKRLIAAAYLVRLDRVFGGPDWIASDRYTIEAKAEDGAMSPGDVSIRVAELRVMLQQLLADRFALRIHHEAKEADVYALGVTRGRPKLQAADRDCTALLTGPDTCHTFRGGARAGMIGQSVDMADLAGMLGSALDRPVVDRTGIRGVFDMTVGPWNPYVNGVPEGAGDGNAEFGPTDFNALPTLFTLLPDKFGLRLQPTKAALDTIVIDRAQRPSED